MQNAIELSRPEQRSQARPHPRKDLSGSTQSVNVQNDSAAFPFEQSFEFESQKIPVSNLSPSTSFSFSGSDTLSLQYLEKQKSKYTLAWLDLCSLLFFTSHLFDLYFINQVQAMAYVSLALQFSMQTAYFVLLWFCHKQEHRDKLWIPLLLLEIKFSMHFVYLHLPDKVVVRDLSTDSLRFFLQMWRDVDMSYMIAIFQNTFIMLYSIQSTSSRKKVLILVIFITAIFQGINVVRLEYPEDLGQSVKVLFTGFIFLCIVTMDSIFAFSIYYLSSISHMLYKAELEENRKFKHMFNSIQDGVILIDGTDTKFANSIALSIYSDIPPVPEKQRNPFQIPVFFPFEQHEGSHKLGSPCEKLSLAFLQQQASELVHGTIFTTSSTIAACTRMDQVQKIVENQATSEVKFYSIKFVRVSKGSDKEEVMVQISDISLRVYSQYLRVERQYLSLMNSTISHEMRNPLNALTAEIQLQKGHLRSLQDLIQGSPSSLSKTLASILRQSEQSLSIAESSSKLIQFNVEDILALPQLKQGKFTRNVQLVHLEKCVTEVKNIMSFQSQEKKIDVQVLYKGFIEGDILVPLDGQRFQQVLLNYLSNALKFTEKNGTVNIILTHIPASEGGNLQNWRREVEEVWLLKSANSLSQESYISSSEISEEAFSNRDLESFEKSEYDRLERIYQPAREPKLVLTVVDTGVGISLEEQTRLFKLFGTIKRTRSVNTRGVGLGLSISKMICEEFGGEVGLLSKLGEGSAFVGSFTLEQERHSFAEKREEETELSMFLKRAQAKQDTAIKRTLTKQSTFHTQFNRPAPKILVVDDEAYNCEILRAMITSLSIPGIESRLTVCLSAKEALNFIRREEDAVSVVFTDLSMPVMDGYQLLSRIRKIFTHRSLKQPTIAAMTGHTEAEFICRAFQKGADQVYSKPISLEKVKNVLLEGGIEIG